MRAPEHELAVTVGTGTGRWLTEMRLAVVGIIVSVALGTADIALSVSTWPVALAAGLASTAVFVALLWRLRPRTEARRAQVEEDLRFVAGELDELRTTLAETPDPVRDLLETLAAQADALAEQLDRIAEEAYLTTESGDALRRVRAYDADLHGLRAEIRCLLARAG